MLRWRFPLAVLIIAALAGLCWLDARSAIAGLWLLPAALVFTVLASGEVLHLAAQGGMSPQRAVVYLGNLALVVSPWAPVLARHLGYHWTPAAGACRYWCWPSPCCWSFWARCAATRSRAV